MKISLVGLSQGVHEFSLRETPESCGLGDHPDFTNDVQIECQMDIGANHIYVLNRAHTVIRYSCDRCLEEFDYDLKEEGRSIFSTDADLVTDSDSEVLQLDLDAKEIDLTEEIRNLLLLAVPIKRLCSEDCKGLCDQCGTNLNLEQCNCSVEYTDPRWDALKKLLKKE